jgi:methionyl-tRNA synthetase
VGHILDPLIGDVLARHHRLKGYEVRFLAGTDEHGAKIVRAAEAAGKTPLELVDDNSERFRRMHRVLGIAPDDFIRTSDQKRHWPGAVKMWRALKDAGDIYWKKYKGIYCVGHEAFITEKDLVGGRCRDHQREPEVIEEENWFFRLSKYSEAIRSRIEEGTLRIVPESRKNEILSFIADGLEDISCSRPRHDLSWGVPVPDDPTQTMYVWLEALTSYISSLGYGQEDQLPVTDYRFWWPADLQVIGKDNLRFHAAIWPGMLLSAGLALPKAIFVHGFVNVEGQKISKTVGNVIAPEEVVAKYGADAVRYYFLREFPSHEDGDFSYKKFEERYNGDLANGLGNLVARVVTLAQKVRGPIAPFPISDLKLQDALSQNKSWYKRSLENFRLHDALAAVWELIHHTDVYINEERPWETDKPIVVETLLALLGEIARLLIPFLPETARKINEQIGGDGREIKKGGVLFPRLG